MKLRRPGPLAMALALCAPGIARAQVNTLPGELEGVGIDEKPGAVPAGDLVFRDQSGTRVRLGDYFDGQRPTVLVLAYYQCPMLCSMVLNGVTEGLKHLVGGAADSASWTAGNRFRVVTISFDTRDTPERARDKRDHQLAAYQHPVAGRGWDFLVGDEQTIKQLTDAIGFHYRWDERQQQFAHGAGAFVFTPDGRLSRTLYGIRFPEDQLRLALVEASAGKLGSAWDRILLFCYHYDPAARGYVLAARRVMQAGGILTVAGISALLAVLFRRKGPVLAAPTERVV